MEALVRVGLLLEKTQAVTSRSHRLHPKALLDQFKDGNDQKSQFNWTYYCNK